MNLYEIMYYVRGFGECRWWLQQTTSLGHSKEDAWERYLESVDGPSGREGTDFYLFSCLRLYDGLGYHTPELWPPGTITDLVERDLERGIRSLWDRVMADMFSDPPPGLGSDVQPHFPI